VPVSPEVWSKYSKQISVCFDLHILGQHNVWLSNNFWAVRASDYYPSIMTLEGAQINCAPEIDGVIHPLRVLSGHSIRVPAYGGTAKVLPSWDLIHHPYNKPGEPTLRFWTTADSSWLIDEEFRWCVPEGAEVQAPTLGAYGPLTVFACPNDTKTKMFLAAYGGEVANTPVPVALLMPMDKQSHEPKTTKKKTYSQRVLPFPPQRRIRLDEVE
jgi:hypothetical protein